MGFLPDRASARDLHPRRRDHLDRGGLSCRHHSPAQGPGRRSRAGGRGVGVGAHQIASVAGRLRYVRGIRLPQRDSFRGSKRPERMAAGRTTVEPMARPAGCLHRSRRLALDASRDGGGPGRLRVRSRERPAPRGSSRVGGRRQDRGGRRHLRRPHGAQVPLRHAAVRRVSRRRGGRARVGLAERLVNRGVRPGRPEARDSRLLRSGDGRDLPG